jgi:hypothetical protein
MYDYSQGGPAQWAAMKQRQSYGTMQNLLNMLMRIKMMKDQEGVRQQEREEDVGFRERQFESQDAYRDAQIRQWDKPPIPKPPTEAELKRRAAISDPDRSTKEKLYFLQTMEWPEQEEEIPTSVHQDFKGWLVKNYGPDWRKGMSYGDFKDIRDHYQELIRGDRAKKAPAPNAKKNAQLKRDSNYMKNALARLTKERERMVKGLDPSNKKFMAQQQPRIVNIDKGISELDRINSLLVSGEPLPPEEFDKAKDILTNMELVKSGLYDFDAGASLVAGDINEKGLTKEQKKTIQVNPATGERVALVNGEWKLITKKK